MSSEEKKSLQKGSFFHFDDIFARFGNVGRFQVFCFAMLSIRSITMSSQLFTAVFIVPPIAYRCQIPGLSNDSFTPSSPAHAQLINQSIPCEKKDGRDECVLSQCEVYVGNTTQACTSWVFDDSIFHSTVTEDFSLVCKRKDMISHLKMVMMLGIFVGSPIAGQLSDLIGRKIIVLVGFALTYIFGIVQIFSPNVWVMLALRFIIGFAIGLFQVPSFVLLMELIGGQWRMIFGILSGGVWCFGGLYVSLVAYFVRDWKTVQVITTVPWIIVYILLAVFVPESPRWLIIKKKLDKAEKSLSSYSKWNKKPKLTRDDIESIANNMKPQPRTTMLAIFKSKILTIRALCVWFMWFVYSFVYYGIIWNSGSFSGNIFLNYSINTLTELPCYLLGPLMLMKFGRKPVSLACFVLGGICCICTIFPYLYGDPENDTGINSNVLSEKYGESVRACVFTAHIIPKLMTLANYYSSEIPPRRSQCNWTFWGMMTLVLLGKFAVSLNFQVGFVYTSEMFSTATRTATQGTASSFARVGGMLAPYIADLPNYVHTALGQSLSQIIYGIVSIVAGLCCIVLPETKDVTQLPDTIEEAENLGRKPRVRADGADNNKDAKRVEEDALL